MIGYKTKLILNPNADWGHTGRMIAELRPLVEKLGEADWSERFAGFFISQEFHSLFLVFSQL